MYAVVKTGGKQYRVAPGEKVRVEQLDADVGAEVVLSDILLVADGESVRVGRPRVDGAAVNAVVVQHGRGDKVRIYKLRRRKHYERHAGHRQGFTELLINGISG